MIKPRIFFLHNPKAGGSSLRATLRSIVKDGSVAPVFGNSPNEDRASRSMLGRYKGYDFYAGHYGYEAYRRLSAGHILITNFREPASRIYSIYRYWRNNVSLNALSDLNKKNVAIVEEAHNLSFSEFIRSTNSDLKLYLNNFHFRQLLHSGWEEAKCDWRSRWLVKRRISRMPWFYIAETPKASSELLNQLFCDARGAEIPYINQSVGEAGGIDPKDVEHLSRLNTLDFEIYSYALRLQEERLRKAGRTIEE